MGARPMTVTHKKIAEKAARRSSTNARMLARHELVRRNEEFKALVKAADTAIEVKDLTNVTDMADADFISFLNND